jgi:cytochrome c oxidase cbb3-type subunit 3
LSAFGPAKLAALVSYLRTLQGRTGETLLPGDPVKGKALFYGQAKCADCHMVNGRGGFFGPDLTYYASTLDAQGVRTKITNPDKDLDPRRGTVNVTLADSSSISGLPRNEDNFSLQLQTLDGTFHLLSKSDIRNQTYTGSSGMPANYSSTLSASELNDLVSYLLSVSGSRNLPKTVKPSEDEDDE